MDKKELTLEVAADRNTPLHCHISEDNKNWLIEAANLTNRRIGDVVDYLIMEARTTVKLPSSEKRNSAKAKNR